MFLNIIASIDIKNDIKHFKKFPLGHQLIISFSEHICFGEV